MSILSFLLHVGFRLELPLVHGSHHRFDGFVSSDFEKISGHFVKVFEKDPIKVEAKNLEGKNWGEISQEGQVREIIHFKSFSLAQNLNQHQCLMLFRAFFLTKKNIVCRAWSLWSAKRSPLKSLSATLLLPFSKVI